MKRISVLLITILLLLLTVPAYAHPGKTDGNGGHYNRSTGEYHYHHGYAEHQHPGGVCPYAFDDRTGYNSGTSSGSTSDDGPYVLPQLKDEASPSQDKPAHETIGPIAGLAITFSPVALYALAALLFGKRRK